MTVRFALDWDKDSIQTFSTNFPYASAFCGDIRSFNASSIDHLIDESRRSGHLVLFCGCAPCQPFTKQRTETKKGDKRIFLLLEFLRFIERFRPEYIFVENVPGIQKVNPKIGPLKEFMRRLQELGYPAPSMAEVDSCDYGVPQKRRRFLLADSLLSSPPFPKPSHGPGLKEFSTVSDWIAHFPPIKAGEAHPDSERFPNHVAAGLSSLNLERIRHTPPGGGYESWPQGLRLRCHLEHPGHTDVYGRLAWDRVASGLTTRCISYSNGRFGHPEQDRAISVREAAALQTFPDDFRFSGSLQSMARQIGNAVPVLLAQTIGASLIEHLLKH
jgi:DNA (cytosine-5)-methyltransferase 1